VYDGDWIHGSKTGYATFVARDKFSTYKGDFVDGERHGYGEQLFADKSVYVGCWERNERSGYGRQDFAPPHPIDFYEGHVSSCSVGVCPV
jgi:hypothetical protein